MSPQRAQPIDLNNSLIINYFCSYHIPELRIKNIPELKVGKEVRIELTLQNPTPYVLHVTLFDLDESPEASAAVRIPDVAMALAPKDDTADLDIDQNISSQFSDDKK